MINTSADRMRVDPNRQLTYSLPLRISHEDVDNLPPLEKAYAKHLIETRPGEVFIVVDADGGGDARKLA